MKRQPAFPDEGAEALAARLYERCHPGDTFEDLKRRARFAKEDKGLLRNWRAAARIIIAESREK